jgi:flagellin-like protein
MNFGKRGISAIVATVLIIAITIAAVAIIWGILLPFLKEGTDFRDPNSRLGVATSGGYTFYDPSSGMLYVQVKRGADSANMVGLEIIVTIGGNSKTYKYGPEYVPAPNQAVTIKIWVLSKPDYVKVVPIFLEGGVLKRGQESPLAEIENGTSNGPGTKTPTVCDTNNDCYNGEVCGGTKKCGCSAGEVDYQGGCAKEILCGFDGWESGKNYLLGSDQIVSGPCFTITQSNIVLDGNGKRISGDGNGVDYGIYASGRTDLTIKNFGEIKNFSRGIYFNQVSDSVIEDNVMNSQIAQETSAIYLEDGDSNTVKDNHINWNTTGSLVQSSGVYLFVSSGKTLGNNQIIGNELAVYGQNLGSVGVYFENYGTSSSNVIRSNTILARTDFSTAQGVGVFFGNSGTFIDNSILSNSINVISSFGWGIYFNNAGALMNSNTIQGNSLNIFTGSPSVFGFGIDFFNTGASMSSNKIQSNNIEIVGSSWAVRLYNSGASMNANIIQENTICSLVGNARYSFYCSGATGTNGTDNQFTGLAPPCDGWPVLNTHYTAC